jgi:hypothetical protein
MQNRTGRTGQAEKNMLNRTGRRGQVDVNRQKSQDQERQNQDRQNRTGRTGQAEQEGRAKIAQVRTGLAE